MYGASSTRSTDVPRVVFDHRHAVEGFVRGVLDDHGGIQFSARWPFDRDTGEEIYVATRVGVPEYAACLVSLAEARHGRAEGESGGFIEFIAIASGGTRFELGADGAGPGTRLSLNLSEAPEAVAAQLLAALDAPAARPSA